MGLLGDIQNAALDPKTSIADMLRRCQILAVRLRHDRFKAWVSHELNGYPDDAEMPTYRGPFTGDMKATLIGFTGQATNVSVPTSNIPAEYRAEVLSLSFRQGVGELASMLQEAARTDEGRIGYQLAAELAALIPVWQGFNTVDVNVGMPVTVVSGILDQVRSRALEFALEIEAENPRADEVAGSEPPVPLSKTDVIFNTTIYGGSVAVGPGARVQVVQGDLGSLMRYLEAVGVDPVDRRELESAIEADDHNLGPRIKAWLGGFAVKAIASGGRIAEATVTAAVARYFGLS